MVEPGLEKCEDVPVPITKCGKATAAALLGNRELVACYDKVRAAVKRGKSHRKPEMMSIAGKVRGALLEQLSALRASDKSRMRQGMKCEQLLAVCDRIERHLFVS